jgi:hypothetical protein
VPSRSHSCSWPRDSWSYGSDSEAVGRRLREAEHARDLTRRASCLSGTRAVGVSTDSNGRYGHGLTVSSNSVTANALDGILIKPFGSEESPRVGHVVSRNLARKNGDDGIDIENPQTTVVANSAYKVDLGIEAVPGVDDDGANRAFGNGNPLQWSERRLRAVLDQYRLSVWSCSPGRTLHPSQGSSPTAESRSNPPGSAGTWSTPPPTREGACVPQPWRLEVSPSNRASSCDLLWIAAT